MRVAYGVDSGHRLVRIIKKNAHLETVEYRLAVESWEWLSTCFVFSRR